MLRRQSTLLDSITGIKIPYQISLDRAWQNEFLVLLYRTSRLVVCSLLGSSHPALPAQTTEFISHAWIRLP